MKVLVVGENKSSNLGDQAIFSGLSLYLNERNHVVESLDLSGRSAKETKETSKRIRAVNISVPLVRAINIFRSMVVIAKKFDTISNHIKNNDLIVFGGGSLLIDNNMSFPSKLFFYSLLVKLFKKDYVVIGCSGRPVSSKVAGFMLDYFIKGASKVGLRDIQSIHLLGPKIVNGNCFFTPDPALFLSKTAVIQEPRQDHKAKIGVNVMSPQKHGFFSDPNQFQNYMMMIQNLIEELNDYDVFVFTTGDVADNSFVLEYFESFENVFIPDSLENLLLFLSSTNRIFATRLHASILALTQGVRPYIFSWDDKVIGFSESFGMNDFCTDLRFSNICLENCMDYVKRIDAECDKELLVSIKNEMNNSYGLVLGDSC